MDQDSRILADIQRQAKRGSDFTTQKAHSFFSRFSSGPFFAGTLFCLCLSPLAITKARAELVARVEGTSFSFTKNFFDNLSQARTLTTFLSAINAADLGTLLQDPGPFTLFAPTNEAFTHLPKGQFDSWMQPDNHEILASLVRYHLVAGKYSVETLLAALRQDNGQTRLKTLQGEDLIIIEDGRRLIVVDARGGRAIMTHADIPEKNGLLHIIDKVLQPALPDSSPPSP